MVKAQEVDRKEIKQGLRRLNDGDSVTLTTYHKVVCLYCNKVFQLNHRDMTKGREIHCAWCGEKHVNTSDKKFKLKKLKPSLGA